MNEQTCESQGFPSGGTLSCSSSCTLVTSQCLSASCGNGNLDSGEQCDDGNINNLDGCSSSCQIEVLTIGYFGFESGIQSWSDTGSDSDRSNARSKVLDNGNDGGSWSFHLQHDGNDAITSQNFDLTGFKEITVKWNGYYQFSGGNDCLEFKIDNTKVSSWGTSGCDNNGITMNSWLSQEITFTNTQFTFDNSVEIRFEGEMNSNNDEFYVDGIDVSGVKYQT